MTQHQLNLTRTIGDQFTIAGNTYTVRGYAITFDNEFLCIFADSTGREYKRKAITIVQKIKHAD